MAAEDPKFSEIEDLLARAFLQWLSLVGYTDALKHVQTAPIRTAAVQDDPESGQDVNEASDAFLEEDPSKKEENSGARYRGDTFLDDTSGALWLLMDAVSNGTPGLYRDKKAIVSALMESTKKPGSWAHQVMSNMRYFKNKTVGRELPDMFANWVSDNYKGLVNSYRGAGNEKSYPGDELLLSRKMAKKAAIVLKPNKSDTYSGPLVDSTGKAIDRSAKGRGAAAADKDKVWSELQSAMEDGKEVRGFVVDFPSEEQSTKARRRFDVRKRGPRDARGDKSGFFLVTHIGGNQVYSPHGVLDILRDTSVHKASPYIFTYVSGRTELADGTQSTGVHLTPGEGLVLNSPDNYSVVGKTDDHADKAARSLTFMIGGKHVTEDQKVVPPGELDKFLKYCSTSFVNSEKKRAKTELPFSTMAPTDDDESETEKQRADRKQRELSEVIDSEEDDAYGSDIETATRRQFQKTKSLDTLRRRREEEDTPVRSMSTKLSDIKNQIVKSMDSMKSTQSDVDSELLAGMKAEIDGKPSLERQLKMYNIGGHGGLENLISIISRSREFLETMVKFLPEIKPPEIQASFSRNRNQGIPGAPKDMEVTGPYELAKKQIQFLRARKDGDRKLLDALSGGGINSIFQDSVQMNPAILPLVKRHSLAVLSGSQYDKIKPYVYSMMAAVLEDVLKKGADRHKATNPGKEDEFLDKLIGGADWAADPRAKSKLLQKELLDDDASGTYEKIERIKDLFHRDTRLKNMAWAETRKSLQEVLLGAVSKTKIPDVGETLRGGGEVGSSFGDTGEQWSQLESESLAGKSHGSAGGVTPEGKTRYAAGAAEPSIASDMQDCILAIKMASAKLFSKVK